MEERAGTTTIRDLVRRIINHFFLRTYYGSLYQRLLIIIVNGIINFSTEHNARMLDSSVKFFCQFLLYFFFSEILLLAAL